VWLRIHGGRGFGAALATVRKAAGLTQTELAERVGAERTTIINMEHGRHLALGRAVNAFATAGYELIAVPRGANVTVEEIDNGG
jgi:HTH-type transcriptional regulator / antitoxin HipB